MIRKLIARIFSQNFTVYNRSLSITREGWFFTGFTFAVGIAAINTGNNLMYLVLGMMLSVIAVSGVLSEYTLKGVRLERRPPDNAFAGELFKVGYIVVNTKRFLSSYSIRIAEKGVVSKIEPYALMLKAGEKMTVEGVFVAGKRGKLEFTEADVVTRYPFGLFEKTKLVKMRDGMIVFPKPLPAERIEKAGAEKGMLESAAIKGEGMSLLSLREYSDGDNPRKISWKVSARAGKIMVKETEALDMPMTALILDTSGFKPGDDDELLEDEIRKCAGVADELIKRGYLVRLLTDCEDVPYGGGPSHLHRIFTSLALFAPGCIEKSGMTVRPGEARIVFKAHS